MGKLGDTLGKVVTGPLKALIPKNPWIRLLLIALPILLVLALLEPVLSLFEKGVDMFTRLLAPMLESPGGRLLLLNVLLLAVLAVGFLVLRSRIRQLRSGLVLRRHLDGIAHLVGDQPRRARESFRRVAKSRGVPPSEYPAVVEDAKLKLARIALDEGNADLAIRWLTRVRDRDLPKELQRSLAQLRGQAFLEQGEIDAATLRREIETALDKFGNDTVLLAMLRDLAIQNGDFTGAVSLQERVHKHASPRRQPEERRRLVHVLVQAGDAALEKGEPDAARTLAKRAHKVDPDATAPSVLLGRALLAKGDAKGAVREWGRTRSATGLEQVAKLLDEQPGAVSPRELLEACPVQGAVLLVAREYARRGDTARAERAARQAARELGMSPSVAAVLAEVLELCGRSAEARQITEEAVRRLVAPDPAAG